MIDRLQHALSDRYRIERELGAGGMATVYLAFDLKHDRHVALKVLKPELAAVLGADRFVVEIKTTASLQHPHILPLFDSGTADGFLYYVMPFIEGETLRDRLNRETQLGVDDAVRIACEVADALHYAHSRGVIHRDIKPENILLANGRPLVADFGIALAVSAAAGGRMTETGLSLGTPHYMSPEQATAEKEITARSDVYSLGSVLYEMLAGQPPHLGGSAQQIIMKIIAEPVQPVTAIRKTVPPNVAAAVAKSLEKLPADRLQSAQSFIDALRNVAFSTSTSTGVLTERTHRRSRAMLTVAMVFGALVGATGFALLGNTRPSAARGESRTRLTFSGRAAFPAISPDGKFLAFIDRSCRHAQFDLCQSTLFVQEVNGEKPQAIITGASWLSDPRFTFDGATIVIAGQIDSLRSGLFAIPRLGGTPRRIGANVGDGRYDPHPRGDTVVVMTTTDSTVLASVIVISTGQVVDTIRFSEGVQVATLNGRLRLGPIAWTSSGRHLVSIGRTVRVFSRDGRLTDSTAVFGRSILRRAPGGAILIFQPGVGKEDELVRIRINASGRVAAAPDTVLSRFPTLFRGHFDVAERTGDLIVSTGEALFDIWTFDLSARNAPVTRRTQSTAWYGNGELDPDGKTLFYLRADALGDNLYAVPLATGIEEALTSQRLGGRDFSHVSSDGKRVVTSHFGESGSLTMTVVDLATRRAVTHPVDSIGEIIWPLPNKSMLSFWRRRLMLSDSAGAALRQIALPDTIVSVAGFVPSPDGDRVAIAVGFKGDTRGIAIVELASGKAQLITVATRPGVYPGISWLANGSIIVTQWREEDEWPTAWRLESARGTLDLIHTIRVSCHPALMMIAYKGARGACTSSEDRSDLWLYQRLPGMQ